MTRERKENVTVCSAIAMLIFGCVLTTIGFFLEPIGVVHDSVLWVLGQCFIYAGGALGIANYARGVAKQEVDDYMRHRNGHVKSHAMADGDDDFSSYEKGADDTAEEDEA